MARLVGYPKLCHHKASGRAVVCIEGRDHYCGPWLAATNEPSREALSQYHRLISEWLAADQTTHALDRRRCGTLAEICIAYLEHAKRYYRKDGRPTAEVHHVRSTIRVLLRLYADLPPEEFRALELEACRQSMIATGLARTTINQHTCRIKRIMAWAGKARLIDELVYHRLLCVQGLRTGRGGREPRPRQPAAWAQVEAIRAYVSPQVWALVQLQWHTGMRSGSLVIVRGCDLEMSGPVWFYTPSDHKMRDAGMQPRALHVALGPRAQQVLRPWLRGDPAACLFQPAEAVAAFYAARRARRVTPLWPSHCRRRRAYRPRRKPGKAYTTNSYHHAIARACASAAEDAWQADRGALSHFSAAFREFLASEPPRAQVDAWRAAHGREGTFDAEYLAFLAERRWTPHQLRHAYATRAQDAFGGELDTVAAALGHKDVNTTQLYAHIVRAKAAKVALRIG